MTSEEILYGHIIKHFNHTITTMTEVAKSDNFKFIEMFSRVIDFDEVSRQIGKKNFNAQYFSVDTILYCKIKNCLYLVEFKDGWPKDKVVNELRLKAYDTLCMLKLIAQNIDSDCFDFRDVKINYVVITRGDSKQEKFKDSNGSYHASFLNTLGKRKPFKLGLLDNTVIKESKVLVTESKIYDFLSRVTKEKFMVYHMKNGSGQLKFEG